MAEEQALFAPEFKRWADAFASDARLFCALVEETRLPADVRRIAAGALNYMLLQMDVVPDHVPVLGVLDDAMVLRVAAALIVERDAPGTPAELGRLANDDEKVQRFLGKDDYATLRALVTGLEGREVRKRTPAAVVDSDKERRHLIQEIETQLGAVRGGTLEDPAKLERDLRSYFKAKLGRI